MKQKLQQLRPLYALEALENLTRCLCMMPEVADFLEESHLGEHVMLHTPRLSRQQSVVSSARVNGYLDLNQSQQSQSPLLVVPAQN